MTPPKDRLAQATPATPTERRIWLCADDYGIAPGVNAAIRDLVARRRINATSVMVVAPSFTASEATSLAALNRETRHVAVGLHVTLTAPFRPQSAGFAPLTDGAFPPLTAMMQRAIRQKLSPLALAAEVAAQLEGFRTAFGRPPDFVDGHQHVHLLPQVRTAVLDAVAKAAPNAWVRQCGRPRGRRRKRLADPKSLILDVLSLGFVRRAAQHGLATNSAFAGAYTFRPEADFAARFPEFLDGMPDGGLIMCHPGTVDAELARLDPLTTLREREYAFLASDAFPRVLAAHGVTLA